MKLKGKQQSDRLTTQQKASDGVIGIFDTDAQNHDKEVHNTSLFTMQRLKEEFPNRKSMKYYKRLTSVLVKLCLCQMPESNPMAALLK